MSTKTRKHHWTSTEDEILRKQSKKNRTIAEIQADNFPKLTQEQVRFRLSKLRQQEREEPPTKAAKNAKPDGMFLSGVFVTHVSHTLVHMCDVAHICCSETIVDADGIATEVLTSTQ
jgi:hypothetical protein